VRSVGGTISSSLIKPKSLPTPKKGEEEMKGKIDAVMTKGVFVLIIILLCADSGLSDRVYAASTTITTGVGNGADTFVTYDAGCDVYCDENYGWWETIAIKHDSGTGLLQRKAYLRFDIDSVADPIEGVRLELVYVSHQYCSASPSTYNVYGLNDGHVGESWGESTITWNNAPANDNSGDGVLPGQASLLGTFSVNFSTMSPSGVVLFSSSAFLDFVQSDTNGLITLIVTRQQRNLCNEHFASKENATFAAPTLDITIAAATGACCLPDGSCTEGTEGLCTTAGGTYQGDGTVCASVDCFCDCSDTDRDGVPDAWDECPNTPEGSCVYSNGCPCPAAIPLFICALEPNVANPGDVIKIFGSGFGSMQGDSILHIGDETFDQNSSNIQLWSDCKLEFMVSEHECNWWGLRDYREEDVWVTVNDEDSNKKTLKIIRPKDCAFCSDNLWNIRVNAEDFFHSNEAWVRPWRGSTDDGWGQFRGGYGYEFQWHHGPYAQPSGSVSSTLSWTINGQGKLKVAGTRDHQWHAWTYVYVSAPKTLEIPFAKGNGTCVPRFFVNEDFDTPYQYIDKTYVTLHLVAGWNRIDISGYNQNDNFNFDLNYNLAKNVDRMNSTECTTDNGCICPTVYQPVCGVDGNTYSNGCYAACAGVDVAYSGECTP
jgi:hypothetical protein